MNELELFFSELNEEELDALVGNMDFPQDEKLSAKIKENLNLPSAKKKLTLRTLPTGYILTAAALFFVVITTTVLFIANNNTPKPQILPQTTTAEQHVSAPVENPLMVAISSGDEDTISRLLSLPALISQETLEFALNFANLLSYDTLSKIASSVKEKLGSTGLDSLLEGSIFGDSQIVLKELSTREELTMSPFEKLAFFFAVAFCDSEVVDSFISRGYDINIKDFQGNSIYAIAEKYNNEDNMKYAISKGITS